MIERAKYIVYWDQEENQKKVVYSFERGGHGYLVDFYNIAPETISSFGVVQCEREKKTVQIIENAVWENPGKSKIWKKVFEEDNPIVIKAFQEHMASGNQKVDLTAHFLKQKER